MNISTSKIVYYAMTFQKSKIPEYLLSVGNNWIVNVVADGTQDKIKSGLTVGKSILLAMKRYSWLCPEKWRSAYELTVQAFTKVVDACSDLQLSVDEITGMTNAFKIAYAEWCAD